MLTSIVYSYILLFFMTKIEPGLFMCKSNFCNADLSHFESDVYLIYYNCSDNNSRTSYPLTAAENIAKKFDKNKPIVIYIFGWLQYPDHPNVQSMMNALCFGGDANVVLLDWSKYSNSFYSVFYPIVFSLSQKVGILFGQCVQKLDSIYNVSNMHVIGFSLGAHIAGFAGKCINHKISRITGLDPANPLLSGFAGCYLKSDDAVCVEVYHSDMFWFGTPPFPWMAKRHIFVNGGCRFQPNCPILPTSQPELFCSHNKSCNVYDVSLLNPDIYTATQCLSFKQPFISCIYKKNECNGRQIRIGYHAKDCVQGSFYLDTHGQ